MPSSLEHTFILPFKNRMATDMDVWILTLLFKVSHKAIFKIYLINKNHIIGPRNLLIINPKMNIKSLKRNMKF